MLRGRPSVSMLDDLLMLDDLFGFGQHLGRIEDGPIFVVSYMNKTTTQGRTILVSHPYQLPPCPCVCYQNALSFSFLFFFFFDTWSNLMYFNHVVLSFKKNAMWLLMVGLVVLEAKPRCL